MKIILILTLMLSASLSIAKIVHPSIDNDLDFKYEDKNSPKNEDKRGVANIQGQDEKEKNKDDFEESEYSLPMWKFKQ